MEDRLWEIIESLVPDHKRNPRHTYSDRQVLLVVLWAGLHDRPISWACQSHNWPVPRSLPHDSTISRRTRQPGFAALLKSAEQALRERLGSPGRAAIIDGKPLVISDYSRDPDSRNGRAYRGFSRGYKLHAVVDLGGAVLAHEVLPLNVNERVPAARMLVHLPESIRRVLADGNYDSSKLHSELAVSHIKLYSPPHNNYAGQHSHPRRHRLIRLQKHSVGRKIENQREHIERQFGLMGNYGCGMKGLPHWVRRLHRVTRWIDAKLLIHHAYLISRQNKH